MQEREAARPDDRPQRRSGEANSHSAGARCRDRRRRREGTAGALDKANEHYDLYCGESRGPTTSGAARRKTSPRRTSFAVESFAESLVPVVDRREALKRPPPPEAMREASN